MFLEKYAVCVSKKKKDLIKSQKLVIITRIKTEFSKILVIGNILF